MGLPMQQSEVILSWYIPPQATLLYVSAALYKAGRWRDGLTLTIELCVGDAGTDAANHEEDRGHHCQAEANMGHGKAVDQRMSLVRTHGLNGNQKVTSVQIRWQTQRHTLSHPKKLSEVVVSVRSV